MVNTLMISCVRKTEHHTYIPLVLYSLPEHAPTKTERFLSTRCDTHREDTEERPTENDHAPVHAEIMSNQMNKYSTTLYCLD